MHHPDLSIVRQCELLGLSRSSWYYQEQSKESITGEEARLMKLIDKLYTQYPFYGSRRIREALRQELGYPINRKLVQRLMRVMGIQGLSPGPQTSKSHPEHKKYPYLLRDYKITKPNQVWSTDITFVPMPSGFMYLVAIIDWYSRYVLSWELSNTADTTFCLSALDQALEQGKPEIFNTDQGVQFTSHLFTTRLLNSDIKISMDGRGRALDNIFVERLWRTVKYEHVYLHNHNTVPELRKGLKNYFKFYNTERFHQSLDYLKPIEVHHGK